MPTPTTDTDTRDSRSHDERGAGTKERLLEAAERLFADAGIEAASLRAITSAAGANLAAVHYHFGSKDGLAEAVFERRVKPLNAERLALLDRAEDTAKGQFPALEAILTAFLEPAIRRSREPEHADFIRLMGRMYSEPSGSVQQRIARHFGDVIRRFTAALERALPDLSSAEVFWRFHFVVGVLVHSVADPARIEKLSGGLCDPSDTSALTRRLVRFLSAGMRAAPTTAEHDRESPKEAT